MAAVSKRRRFQAPITSFFNVHPSSSPNGTFDISNDQHSVALSAPPIPGVVQSSLLAVGMRVRKSVAEGYKTAPYSQQPQCVPDSGCHDYEPGPLATNPSTGCAGYTELTPFCGLHKIGGMAVQPMPSAPAGSSHDFVGGRSAVQAEESGLWSMPSSQESVNSHALAMSSNKRVFTFDEDDADRFEQDMVGSQQTAYPFSHTRMPDLNALLSSPTNQSSYKRVVAIPRSRFPGRRDRKSALEGQENGDPGFPPARVKGTGHGVQFRDDLDFQDAEFLQAREDVDAAMRDY